VRLRSFVAVLLSCALLAAACSSEDDDATGGDASTGDVSEVPSDAPIQGLSDTEIKIGVAYLLLGNIEGSTQWEAAFKQARDEGRLPVHGRDIKPVYHLIDITSAQAAAESHRAACVKFTDEEKVFMGLGAGQYLPTAQCMAGERQFVFIGAAGSVPNDDVLAQANPFLFVNNMSPSKLLRNWPHWADDQGFLEDKKLGLVVADVPTTQAEIDASFKPELDDLGYRLTEEVRYTDATSVPGIVQRLKASGVEVVFLDASASLVAFAQELEAQNYHPKVLATDHDQTSTTSSLPRDGIPASFRMTAMTSNVRASDGIAGNPPEPELQQQCVNNYAKYYGKQLVQFSGGRPTPDYSNFHNIQHICDIVNYLIDVLEAIGPDLTPTSLIHGLETEVKGVKSGEVLDITFGPGDHSGSEQIQTIEWNPACLCWSHTDAGPRDVFVE
jgi:ABC-type branched-subunit amino acid transport system substrate-binding protein